MAATRMHADKKVNVVDKNYRNLAQLDCFDKDMKQEIIENIFSNDDSINYQIPANDFFKLKKPNCIGNTALHIALEKGNFKAFDTLIKLGADFTIKNGNGASVLHQAMEFTLRHPDGCGMKLNSKKSFIESILSAHVDFGISTNPIDKYGVSHFHIACVADDVKATEFFLKNGASVSDSVSTESPIFPGYTPLHFAVTYHSDNVVEVLLKNGADPNVTDIDGLSSLHLLIKRNMEIILHEKDDSKRSFSWFNKPLESNDRLINLILGTWSPNQWNVTDSIGLSRYHVVSMLQSTSLVEKATEEGADLQLAINADSPFLPGYTALHFAAQFNNDTFKILLKNGGNVTAEDAKGVTPFDIRLKRCNSDFIHHLISCQPLWNNITFSDNETGLIHFVEHVKKEKKIMNFLRSRNDINSCIPFNSPIWSGYTFLHLATVFIGKTELNDLDINEYDTDYDSSQYQVFRNTNIIRLCLKLGADATIQDVHGSTALHLAFHMCKQIAVNAILKYCDNDKIVNPIDKNGLSHLHIACAAKYYLDARRDEDASDGEEPELEEEDEEKEEVGENLVKNLLHNGVSPNCSLTSTVEWGMECGKKVFLNVGWTPLHVAVATSNLRLIKILLEHGADIYAKDINGLTPIHLMQSNTLILAFIKNNTDISDFLFSTENLKDSIANCGLSHLHVACYVRNASAVRRLLENGANTETIISYRQPLSCKRSNDQVEYNMKVAYRKVCFCDPILEPLSFVCPFAGCTPLLVALKQFCDAEITGLLVRYGANIHAKSLAEKFPFYRILEQDVIDGTFSIIPELKTNETLQKCIEDHTGITMLHVYCAILDVDAVVELLDSGANANAKVHVDSPLWAGCTPLHLISHDHAFHLRGESTFQGFDIIADLLLKKGADVLSLNARQDTPVHKAFWQFLPFQYSSKNCRHKPDFVTLLLKKQRDFRVIPTDTTGLSHFHIACLCGDVTMVEEFLKHDVDVNSPIDCFSYVDGGFTPLHFAVIGQSKEVVDVLLKDGANPNSCSSLDDNSLHLAVKFNLTNEDLFQCLISAGADMRAKNLYGETPMDLLFNDHRDSKATEIFLKCGVCVNIFNEKTNEGRIASVVRKRNSNEIFSDPLFLAPILNAGVNDDDEMGRSPIHNIVSTDTVFISAKDYTNIIEKYIEVGFDVDRRDRKGRTALHLAVQFKNVKGIVALLENGTDINIKDESCNTPYAYCLQFDERNKDYVYNVFKVLKIHIDKLRSFGLDVSQINRICDRTINFSHVSRNSHHETEIDELSKTKIDDSHPFVLLDFLSETNVVSAYPTMPRVVRDAVDTFFQTKSDHLRQNFPDLACLLQLQYRKARIRMTIIDSAKSSLNFISAVEIPDLCSDIILRLLANEDLNNLIRSADVEWQPNKRIRLD